MLSPSLEEKYCLPRTSGCLPRTRRAALTTAQLAALGFMIQLHSANWCELSLRSPLKVSVFLTHVHSSFQYCDCIKQEPKANPTENISEVFQRLSVLHCAACNGLLRQLKGEKKEYLLCQLAHFAPMNTQGAKRANKQ